MEASHVVPALHVFFLIGESSEQAVWDVLVLYADIIKY